MGWHYKEPDTRPFLPDDHVTPDGSAESDARHNATSGVTSGDYDATGVSGGYWDTADGRFVRHGDTAKWHKDLTERTGFDQLSDTPFHQHLTPLNDERPECVRIPCKEGEIFIARDGDGVPEFYKTRTPFGDMYLTSGPQTHRCENCSKPTWDSYGRYSPPKNVQYSVEGTTDCCEATCHNPDVIQELKASDTKIQAMTDEHVQKACGYGCFMWLRHSSLNWENERWQPMLKEKCVRDCEQPRKWKNFVHFTFSGASRTGGQPYEHTENSPWLTHPMAQPFEAKGTGPTERQVAQEAVCMMGCSYYDQCFGVDAPVESQKTHTNPELDARLDHWRENGALGNDNYLANGGERDTRAEFKMPGQAVHGFGDDGFGGYVTSATPEGQRW
jgi:hypothetical protein